MAQDQSFLSATIAELTRRKVPRVVGAYAVGVFVLLQLMDAAVDPLRLPEWLPTIVVIVLILGFPVVFLLAWQFDLTPTGVKKASSAGVLNRTQSASLFSVSLTAMLGLGYVFYVYYSGVFEADELASTELVVTPTSQLIAPEASIAVLPFDDLSQQGDQAYFSDGVAEEILNLLAKVDGLHVAARTSSFRFRKADTDIREIGRLLNVRTVLEGSIRSSGDKIRLTAQLINVEDGYHIWSETFDRELKDIFAIQDEIASSIARSLVDSFASLEQKNVGQTDNLAAANAYRTGRQHWWRRTPAELELAIGFFAEAVEHDASFAPAYAAMADSWMLLSLYGNISELRALEKAEPMINRALEIDPESAEAFAALGLARWQIGQVDAAESSLRRAVKLNDDYVPAKLWLAGVLGEMGRYPEEHLVLKQAMELDPLNELLAVNYAGNLKIRGEAAKAQQILKNLVSLYPDSTVLLRALAGQEWDQGNLVAGWKYADRAYRLESSNPADLSMLAKTWITLGELEEAERLLQEGLQKSGQNSNVLSVYFFSLMVAKRYEEAEGLVRRMMAEAGEDVSANMLQVFNMQLGMIALAKSDIRKASKFFNAAIASDQGSGYETTNIIALTMAALVSGKLGEPEVAQQQLANAERQVLRARVNGVDDSEIYYTEATILALKKNVDGALEKLQEAYDRGFREIWLLTIDGRLDFIRDEVQFVDIRSKIQQDIDAAVAEIQSTRLASL